MARRRYASDREYDRGGYSSSRPRRTRYRRERRNEERQIETLCFGLIIVLFAITLLFNVSAGMISLLGGAILTAGAVYQFQRRWRVNPMTWIGGVFLLVVGFMGLQKGGDIPGGWLVPIGGFALVIVASFLTGEF